MVGYHPPSPTAADPPLGTDTPPGNKHPPGTGTPPAQCMLGDTVNKRAVCILLEFKEILRVNNQKELFHLTVIALTF